MRGSDTRNDTTTGAVVRRNVIALLEASGMTPAELYTAIGWNQERFWGQFSTRARGPRLDFVELVAEQLGVPTSRLLTREGEAPPEVCATGDPLSVRQLVRMVGGRLATACEIPQSPRPGESPINFRVRQNVAIGCWQAGITHPELYRRLGIQRATWGSWFRRKTGIALADIWRIAEALEMQPWELIAEVNGS